MDRLGWIGVCASLLASPLLPQASAGSRAGYQAGYQAAGPAKTEDQVFDANRTTPMQLLRTLYETHRVLILAFPSHGYDTQYQMLDSLLQRIGHDPRLKRILLERSDEDAPMLEAASTTGLTIPALISRFPSKDPITSLPSTRRASFSLCLDAEWAYTWATFLPHMQALNAQRPAGHKIVVTSIDGVSASRVAYARSQSAALAEMEGEHREMATSVNFWTTLWPTLGPSAKVIMLYNVAHVIKTFTVVDEDEQQVPSDWMAMLLRDHPEVASQIAIVLLDPVDSAEGVLRFTQRQGARYPGHAFGIPLAPFQGVIAPADTATFVHVPHGIGAKAEGLLSSYGADFHSSRALPAMLDGVIGLPDVSPWRLQRTESYLPACGTMPFTVQPG